MFKYLVVVFCCTAAFFSFAQGTATDKSMNSVDTITFVHNGYVFQTDVHTVLSYLEIEADSIAFYIEKLRRLNVIHPTVQYDSIIPLGGNYDIAFIHLIRIFKDNYSLITIRRAADHSIVNYKVKFIKKVYPSNGIGEFSETFLVIRDKKKRKEIVREVIRTSLPC